MPCTNKPIHTLPHKHTHRLISSLQNGATAPTRWAHQKGHLHFESECTTGIFCRLWHYNKQQFHAQTNADWIFGARNMRTRQIISDQKKKTIFVYPCGFPFIPFRNCLFDSTILKKKLLSIAEIYLRWLIVDLVFRDLRSHCRVNLGCKHILTSDSMMQKSLHYFIVFKWHWWQCSHVYSRLLHGCNHMM